MAQLQNLRIKSLLSAAFLVAAVTFSVCLLLNRAIRYVDVDVTTSGTINATLLYDTGNGFNNIDSSPATIMPASGDGKVLRFAVPLLWSVRGFRLDSTTGSGRMILSELRTVNLLGRSRTVVIGSLAPAKPVRKISPAPFGAIVEALGKDGATTLVIEPDVRSGVTPRPAEIGISAALAGGATFVGCLLLSLVFVKLTAFAFFRAAVEASHRLLGRGGTLLFDRVPRGVVGSRLYRWTMGTDGKELVWLSVGAFLAISGFRLAVLQEFGTDVPWFDSWGVEGEALYKAYLTGTLTIGDLFVPCNEHRIFFTRVLSLGTLLLNGLWDNMLQSVINGLIYSATAVALFHAVGRTLTGAARFFWAVAIVVTFSVPYGWENALWGFQSQFYLLVAFSLLVMVVGCSTEPVTGWKLAAFGILQLATLFTMASGLLASAALICMYAAVVARNGLRGGEWKPVLVRTAVAGGVVVIGLLLVPSVGGHEAYKAESLRSFLDVLAHCASWPDIASDGWWVFNWAPWAVLLGLYVSRRVEDRTVVRFTITLGIWVLLQEIATAYSRNPIATFSKYSDPFALGFAVNALAIAMILPLVGKWRKNVLFLLALCWWGANLYSLQWLGKFSINDPLPARKSAFEMQIAKTRGFIQTGDQDLLAPRHKYDIPHRDAKQYAQLLSDPVISPILPRSINWRYSSTGSPYAPLSRVSDALLAASLPMAFGGSIVLLAVGLLLPVKYLGRRASRERASAES